MIYSNDSNDSVAKWLIDNSPLAGERVEINYELEKLRKEVEELKKTLSQLKTEK